MQLVTATRGKAVRAEPIAAIYERHEVHHPFARSVRLDELAAPLEGRADAGRWSSRERDVEADIQPARSPLDVDQELVVSELTLESIERLFQGFGGRALRRGDRSAKASQSRSSKAVRPRNHAPDREGRAKRDLLRTAWNGERSPFRSP